METRKLYRVRVYETSTTWGEVEVEAASQEEARELAEEQFDPDATDDGVLQVDAFLLTEDGEPVVWSKKAAADDPTNPYRPPELVAGECNRDARASHTPDCIMAALTKVVDYLWEEELRDYQADPQPAHIFCHLATLKNWLSGSVEFA